MNDWFFLHFNRIAGGTALAVGLVAYWFFGGCEGAGGGATLAGTVTSGGKPVVGGTVTVIASDNKLYQAPIGPDGRYELKGLPPGPVRAAVSSPNPRPAFGPPPAGAAATPPPPPKGGTKPANGGGGKNSPWLAPLEGPPPAAVPSLPHHAKWFPIPGKYSDPSSSGLTGTAGAGGGLDLKAD